MLKTKEAYDNACARMHELISIPGKSNRQVEELTDVTEQIRDFEYRRNALLKTLEMSKSGYGGILPDGRIVDRREHPEAIPFQQNSLMGIPAPKTIS